MNVKLGGFIAMTITRVYTGYDDHMAESVADIVSAMVVSIVKTSYDDIGNVIVCLPSHNDIVSCVEAAKLAIISYHDTKAN